MLEWPHLVVVSVGGILAGIALWWQVYTHRKARKESADASIRFDINPRGQFLSLTVLNTGERPLYVQEVQLVFKHIGREQTHPDGRKSTPVSATCPFAPRGGGTDAIQPGDKRVYDMDWEHARMVFGMQKPELLDGIWVSVRTAKGEVCRIEEEELIPYFQEDKETERAAEEDHADGGSGADGGGCRKPCH